MLAEQARFLSREARPLIGVKQVVTIKQPAAGAEWLATVAAGEQWRILAGKYSLTTSAAAPTRLIQVQVFVEGAEVYRAFDSTAVAATLTRHNSLYGSESAFFATQQAQLNVIALPMMWLPQGSSVGTNTVGIDVADQYSAVSLYVERIYLTDQQLEVVAEEHFRENRQEVAR